MEIDGEARKTCVTKPDLLRSPYMSDEHPTEAVRAMIRGVFGSCEDFEDRPCAVAVVELPGGAVMVAMEDNGCVVVPDLRELSVLRLVAAGFDYFTAERLSVWLAGTTLQTVQSSGPETPLMESSEAASNRPGGALKEETNQTTQDNGQE